MIFITGPLFSGKRHYAMELLGCKEQDLAARAALDVQDLAARAALDVQDLAAQREDDLEALARELAQYEVVTAAEVGGGVVPMDSGERAAREAAGRLSVLLAQEAQAVFRVFCGVPTLLKGQLP